MTGAASTLEEAPKLFTQCSKCETVFKLSAEVLRAASGQVRCGKCGEVFNALARLAEEPGAFSDGESSLDLEARAYSILETVVAPQVAQNVARDFEEFAAPGTEIARLEILEVDAPEAESLEADRAMEFTLPPGELDRIFVESKKRAPIFPPASAPESAPAPPTVPARNPAAAPHSTPAQVSTPAREPAPARASTARKPAPPQVPVPPPASAPSPETTPEEELPPHPESVAAELPPRNHVSGFEVPEEVRRDMLAEFEQHIAPVLRNSGRRTARRGRLILWLGAAVVSTLLLAAQIMHQNREWFAAHAHGPWGGVVRTLYGAIGAPLPPPANLAAYQLRQWGVTGDPNANGTLRVRASILNTAAQLQPYPLLRVTLADRFGKQIGRRDFEPSEYVGRPTAKLLAPGERIDATLAILDPGKNAEGFEIDVCLRGADQRIRCAADAAPQAKQ